MGTPDFAVPSLLALHNSGFPVKLVVTQPDRAKGRGRRLAPPPVKSEALALHLTVEQPDNIRLPDVVARLDALSPDFLVVVAFGQILPVSILSIPKHGAVNVHASLLPKYRGPAPIQWALIRGEDETGITTMLMDHGVDTGDILLQVTTPIGLYDTAESMHHRLAHMGARLLVETLEKLWQGSLYPTMQQHSQATYAPMLKKQDGLIDWQTSARQLDAFVRAMTPWPGAFCFWGQRRLRIWKTEPIQKTCDVAPGTVVPGFADELRIATSDGLLSVVEIQGDSGKRMAIRDYLRGNPIPAGTVLSITQAD
jgi:methionyl-tRNA formyltransferase